MTGNTKNTTRTRVADCPHCNTKQVAVDRFKAGDEKAMVCCKCYVVSPDTSYLVPIDEVGV